MASGPYKIPSLRERVDVEEVGEPPRIIGVMKKTTAESGSTLVTYARMDILPDELRTRVREFLCSPEADKLEALSRTRHIKTTIKALEEADKRMKTVTADIILALFLKDRPSVSMRQLNEVRRLVEEKGYFYVDITKEALIWVVERYRGLFRFHPHEDVILRVNGDVLAREYQFFQDMLPEDMVEVVVSSIEKVKNG